jgi:hypothetical protein
MSDKDVDAQFADIVAHWDEVATPPVIKAAEDAEAEPAVAPPTDAPRPGVNPPPEMGFVVWRGTSPTPRADDAASGIEDTIDDLDDPDDEDEHFHPGPTAPLPPQEDLHFWGIVVGLVAGPLILLWLVIFRPAVSGWWTLGALALSVGGFVLLVMRQPHTRDENDPDDGARI